MKMVNLRTAYILISVALLFGIAGEVILEFVVKDVKWEGRVIVVVLLMLVAAFVYVALVVSNLLNELRSQHRASTYVTSMIGIEEALRVYAEMGGDDQEYRIKLHSAMREQYAMYLEALQMRESKPEVPEVDALPSASPA